MNMDYCVFQNTAGDMRQARTKLEGYLRGQVTERGYLDGWDETEALVNFVLECLRTVTLVQMHMDTPLLTDFAGVYVEDYLNTVIAETEVEWKEMQEKELEEIENARNS